MRFNSFMVVACTSVTLYGFRSHADTVFTYQGELKENGGLANGLALTEPTRGSRRTAGTSASALQRRRRSCTSWLLRVDGTESGLTQ